MLRHVLERRAGSCCVLISRTFSAAAASPDRLGFGFCKVTIHTWQSSEQNLICMLTAFLKESRCISPCKKKKYMLCMDFSQSFPASGSFPMSQVFASGGQSIGASASASALPMNIQSSFSLGWTDMLQSMGSQSVRHNLTTEQQ